MKRIYKYKVEIQGDTTSIFMPVTAGVIKVGFDPSGDLCMWAMVDPYEATVRRLFEVKGTGEDLNSETWLGTAIGSTYVWHVFEVLE